MPTARLRPAVAAFGGKIYAFGGFSERSSRGGEFEGGFGTSDILGKGHSHMTSAVYEERGYPRKINIKAPLSRSEMQ